MARLTPILLLVTLSTLGCRSKPTDCSSVKSGTFYYKSRYDGNQFIFIRDLKRQKEIRTSGPDTATLAIRWINDCKYTLTFIATTAGITPEEHRFRNIFVQIDLVTDKYYLFTAAVDSTMSGTVLRDTVWRRPPETWRGDFNHTSVPTPLPVK